MFHLPLGSTQPSGLSLAHPIRIDVEISTSSINGEKGMHILITIHARTGWSVLGFSRIPATVPLENAPSLGTLSIASRASAFPCIEPWS